jgi:peptidoglycan-associated lipoprotein
VNLPPPIRDPPPSPPPLQQTRVETPSAVEAVDSNPGRDDSGAAIESLRPTVSEAIGTVNGKLEDVFFAYDKFELSPDASAALRRDADLLRTILRDFPQLQVTVEGHCDERGSAEYNLGLGDRRASRTVAALTQFGMPTANFSPTSYGKEAPQCAESNESCWSRNRRAHFVVRVNATN